MSFNKTFLAVVSATMALSAGAAMAQDKNPLMPPKTAPAKVAEVAPTLAGPTADTKLPPAGPAHAASVFGPANAGSHLGGLSVVAIVGTKAILRGTIGKNTSFAMIGGGDGAEGGKAGSSVPGAAPVAAEPTGKTPAVTLIVSHLQPLQLADGIWVRPDVSGTTVRLFQQPSKEKASGAAGEVMVYAASLETLSPTAPVASDKSDDKSQADK